MAKISYKNRSGFVLVEFLILATVIALVAIVAFAHFKHNEPTRSQTDWKFAGNDTLQYAINTLPETAR